jgi:Family of unknown function (DUF6516)
LIEHYFQQVADTISRSPIVSTTQVTYDKRSIDIGFIRGEVYFLDGSCLHIREFVNVANGVDRYTYSYHYRRADNALVFRYDNAPHYPELSNFPHHKHEQAELNVISAQLPDIGLVLQEIELWVINNG